MMLISPHKKYEIIPSSTIPYTWIVYVYHLLLLVVCFLNQCTNDHASDITYFVHCNFVNLCFSDLTIFFSINCLDEINQFSIRIRSTESASNFLLNFRKLLEKPVVSYSNPFGDNSMSQSKTFLWYDHFKDGWTSVDDNEHYEQWLTSTTMEIIAKFHEANIANSMWTIHELCDIVGQSHRSIQCIWLDNLN